MVEGSSPFAGAFLHSFIISFNKSHIHYIKFILLWLDVPSVNLLLIELPFDLMAVVYFLLFLSWQHSGPPWNRWGLHFSRAQRSIVCHCYFFFTLFVLKNKYILCRTKLNLCSCLFYVEFSNPAVCIWGHASFLLLINARIAFSRRRRQIHGSIQWTSPNFLSAYLKKTILRMRKI